MNSDLVQYVFAVSILHMAYAAYYFMRSGKSLLLFSDSFALASAVFIGFAGLTTCLLWPFWINSDYLVVSVLGFGMTVAVSLASHLIRVMYVKVPVQPRPRVLNDDAARFWRILTWMAIVGAVAASLVSLAGANLGPVPANLAYLAVMISFTQTLTAGSLAGTFRKRSLIPVTTVLVIVGYFLVYFDGGGRLIVATLFYALASVVGLWLPKLAVKKMILIALAPALLFFGYLRGNTGEIEDVLVSADGLVSVFGPYQICSSVINHIDNGIMGFQYFAPLKSTLFFWVPRFVWAQKPVGFGFELTRHFHPELIFQEHSMAATYLGEIYASAGWLAVVLCFFFLVLGVAWLDLKMFRFMMQAPSGVGFLLRALVFSILSAGVFDYVWVGSFTFFSRNILRLVLLMGMVSIVWGMQFLVNSSRARDPGKWALDRQRNSS